MSQSDDNGCGAVFLLACIILAAVILHFGGVF